MRLGRTTVRIYPRKAERGRQAGWVLADYSTGERRLRSFRDLKDAKAEAVRIASLTNAGDRDGAALTGEDRRQLVRATELVTPYQMDVATACALFADAAKLVGPHKVVSAAEYFARLHPAGREAVPLKTAVDEYYLGKTKKKRSPRTLASLRSILGRFSADHPGANVGDFTTAKIQSWLDNLKLQDGTPASAQTRRTFGSVVGSLFESLRRGGKVAENPCKDLEREESDDDGTVEFWTVTQVRALLAAVDPVALPALAIGLFSGLRTIETCRLKWGGINFEEGHIEVKGLRRKRGTPSRRLTPLPDNLKAWLLPHVGKPDELVFPSSNPEDIGDFTARVTEAATKAEVPRIRNGARHSCITHKVAQTGDVARVALESGNSATVVFSHYRGLVSEAEAKLYFAIMPADGSEAVS